MIGHVLVIEPLTTNRIVMKARLACAHYDVNCVKTFEEACQALKERTPSFVFIDGSFGTEVLSQLRRMLQHRSENVEIPIIVLALSANVIDIQDVYKCGGQDLLIWPVKADLMRARMRSLSKQAQTLSKLREKAHFVAESRLNGAQDQKSFSDCSKVIVIARSLFRAQEWADRLQIIEKFTDVEAYGYAEVLHSQRAPTRNAISLLIDDPVSDPYDVLHILSSLKARDEGHKTYFLTAFRDGAHVQAGTALDMGADDVAWIRGDISDLAARLRMLSHLQKQTDMLHACLDAGLRMAVIDPLTGLFNRRYSDDKLDFLLNSARRQNESLAVMLLDIDHFKKVNDRYGHAVGDHVLKRVAEALKEELRDCDLLARIGGEEFLLALPRTSAADAIAAADRIRSAIEVMTFPASMNSAETQSFKITASVGVATSGKQVCARSITDYADKALYLAKSEGRNCARIRLEKVAA